MYKIFLFIQLTLLSCILISCKYNNYHLQDTSQSRKWEKNKRCLLNIQNYQTRGMIVCDSCRKKIRLQFFFQNIDHNYRLVFTDLIGFRYVEINFLENGTCSIRENIKNDVYFYDFEKLIQKFINKSLLLKNFREWVIGLPGTSVNFSLDVNGHLKKINYQYNEKNFLLLYTSYYNNIVPPLPQTMKVYYDKKFYFNIKFYTWNVQ